MNNDIPLSGQIAELAESLKRSETLPHIEQIATIAKTIFAFFKKEPDTGLVIRSYESGRITSQWELRIDLPYPNESTRNAVRNLFISNGWYSVGFHETTTRKPLTKLHESMNVPLPYHYVVITLESQIDTVSDDTK